MRRIAASSSGSTSERPPIRVMHVVDVLALAGMEYGVIKLVNRLDPGRFAPSICCLRHQADSTRTLLDPRVRVFELRRRSGRDLRLVVRLAALFRREQVDVVHSHNWQTFFYVRLAAALARVPVLVHGEHGREAQETPRRRAVLQRWLAKGVDRLVAVSADLGRELEGHWRVPGERVSVIPNGVDLDLFGRAHADGLRAELNLTPGSRVVLNIGGLRPVKDHPTLIRAFARLIARVPEARLLLVGSDAPAGARARLEALAEELGVTHAVRFAGTRQDVPRLLALAEVYVNASLFEGMSNTILEAMAAGRPVVATAVGGNGELVREGLTGFLVPPKDDRLLSDRITRLLTDEGLAVRMGAAGRRQAEQDHALPRMVRDYSDLYEDAVLRSAARPDRTARERVKRATARAIRWTRAGRVVDAVGPTGLIALTYHRVLPLREAQLCPRPSMVMPRDLFEAQMAYLARHYRVLPFGEAVAGLREGRLPRRAVVVTFDDGYRDNHEYAWPILRRYGLPATFFVVTGALDGSVHLWWDEVVALLQHLARRGCPSAVFRELPVWAARSVAGVRMGRPAEAIADEIVTRLNGVALDERLGVLGALRHACGNDRDGPSETMMAWEEVAELKGWGMEIGAHTATHAFLDELDEDGVRREVEESIASLRVRLGAPVRYFSYPRGRVNERLRDVLVRSGIEAAVTTEPGLNRPGSDLLRLKRLDAGYCRVTGGFDRATFEAELQGWFNHPRR